VTFFDANHCAGAVMVLLEGYMGNILYTGDIRYDKKVFDKYYDLYPAYKRNDKFIGVSKHIDLLYLDNTFLKPRYQFPPKHEALKMAINFVQDVMDNGVFNRIFIGMDNYGK